LNQTNNGGLWKLLGIYNMTPGQNHRLELSDRASDPVAADAVVFEWSGLAPPTATWTTSLPRRELYDVQGWWPHTSTVVDSTEPGDGVCPSWEQGGKCLDI
jgi:hypothetical protein